MAASSILTRAHASRLCLLPLAQGAIKQALIPMLHQGRVPSKAILQLVLIPPGVDAVKSADDKLVKRDQQRLQALILSSQNRESPCAPAMESSTTASKRQQTILQYFESQTGGPPGNEPTVGGATAGHTFKDVHQSVDGLTMAEVLQGTHV